MALPNGTFSTNIFLQIIQQNLSTLIIYMKYVVKIFLQMFCHISLLCDNYMDRMIKILMIG